MVDVIEGVRYPRMAPIACPLCGRDIAPRRIPAGFGMQTSVAECTECALAYQTPRPTDEASQAYMNWRWSSDGGYVTDTPKKRRSARRKLLHVEAVHPRRGRLLDFGAGSGAFVRACLDHGWRATGVERSESAVARAREYYSVDLEASIPDGLFDVITLWDVVEHLRDPIALLTDLRAHLQSDGVLIMETGNYHNWRRVLEGDQWGLYLLDHHFYFTPDSLRQTVLRAGFSTLELLDVNHVRPPLRRLLTRPGWSVRAWRAYRQARQRWPVHGDINVMIVSVRA
ncbi:MAG: class I SAM-dependent methyltransferase [Pseudomonadales bacterium]